MSLSFRGDDEGGLGLTLSDNRFLELENERLKKENSKLKEQKRVTLGALKLAQAFLLGIEEVSKNSLAMIQIEEAIKQAEAK